MSLKFKKVLITPEDERHLSDAIDSEEHPEAYRWLCYVRAELYDEWRKLSKGSHLKDAYSDDVWTWNDNDLLT